MNNFKIFDEICIMVNISERQDLDSVFSAARMLFLLRMLAR